MSAKPFTTWACGGSCSRYMTSWSAYIVGDDPQALASTVAVDELAARPGGPDRSDKGR